MHAGLGLRVSKWWQNYIFGWTITLTNKLRDKKWLCHSRWSTSPYPTLFFFFCDALRDGLFLLDVCVPPDMPELEVILHDLCDWDRSDNTLSNTYTGIVKILKAFLWNLQPSLSGTDHHHPQITVDIFERKKGLTYRTTLLVTSTSTQEDLDWPGHVTRNRESLKRLPDHVNIQFCLSEMKRDKVDPRLQKYLRTH